MSLLRPFVSRSVALAARSSTRAVIAPIFPKSVRWVSQPSNPLYDEKAYPEGYREHRVEVHEPKHASVDESLVFEDPEPNAYAKADPGHDVIGEGHGRHTKRTLGSLSMEGKVCVVTGAARGLGNMMARTFVESGADAIVLIDLRKEDAELAAKDLTDWFVEHGEAKPGEIRALGLGCDVANEQSVKDTFAAIKEKFGRLDCLVTAAGIVENFVAHEYPTEKVRKLLDINVMGTWTCALEGAKLMPEGGSIIMIGSMSGSVVNVPQPQTPYNFSKAAVRHMARSLAVEWAKQNIRVNCIAPGYTLTNLTKVILDNNPVLRDEWIHRIPMASSSLFLFS
ncbi:d-arabinitol 2-dehydrogenase [Tremella mesenterica]|uniref:D-arabinitol 2-dehydrogenase n=1 Tax=Tremella mesenterica TaxID=5217 RepID=A0A4V1M547_TREME|nr:d-arabinitol 2-dehydrogenase [Tremella mesenterica]